jgi:hypothetical protein
MFSLLFQPQKDRQLVLEGSISRPLIFFDFSSQLPAAQGIDGKVRIGRDVDFRS